MADAILGESADLAGIAFERVEVRVGGANQDFAEARSEGGTSLTNPGRGVVSSGNAASLMFRS